MKQTNGGQRASRTPTLRTPNEMKFLLIFFPGLFSLFKSTNEQVISTTSLPVEIATTLSPWDQAYLEVFGYLPSDSESQSLNTSTEPTTRPIIIDGPSPELTYQFINGSVQVLGNVTNIESKAAPLTPDPNHCRDRAKNCHEMKTMCNNKLYESSLANLCQSTCQRCGACVDQSNK